MSDGPAPGPNLHALGLLDGKGAPGAEGFKPNEDESPGIILDAADQTYKAVKMFEGLPIIGWMMSFVPLGAGKTSATAGLESEGLAGKQIRPAGGGAQGGFLAKIAGELVKNGAIVNHTEGVGGSAHGEGSASGDSGGSGSGDTGAHSGGSEFAMLSNNGFSDMPHYDFAPIPMASLGELPRPDVPDMRSGRGEGYGMSA